MNKTTKTPDKKNLFAFFIGCIGWLQIFASPFLIALIVASIVYFPNPGTIKLIISLALLLTGAAVGITWANKAWKKKGTISFLSGIMSTPELDKAEEQNQSA